ncbi:MAG: PKD domain-containing protein [Bacteroidetes bacterium]|nr:PKD domain-containing protein [Bacteroidota bacterium]MBT3751415.1 PKD domain-containing protein [Bacteroidota bacterium]MBT4398781.1 PKD domain-containing protein [Bacteroidota bacterium]MBT4412021.1 PKD domain-containing protein [Bacteroidota bacterium]MBT7465749.1 PKD domain-containing protein [Bacteroidota bacterium]
MKIYRFQMLKKVGLVLAAFTIIFSSCKKDEPLADPIASFQYAVSETDYLEVILTNYSQNATSYSWNFGDGETSTESDPTHVYAEAGSYEITLTAKNIDDAMATYSEIIELSDPNSALKLLDGGESKTWRLYREGSSLGVGPDLEGARSWWALMNDGSRPCVYFHEFTFQRDGSFIFDDKGLFWGETALFAGTEQNEVAFEAIPANMINKDGVDVSAWLSGTHAFTYDAVAGEITLTGTGAWMGMPQLSTVAEVSVPDASRTFSATIEQMEGFDLLTITFIYDGLYWDFTYASYSDPSLEPEVVTVTEEYGEDLDDFAPASMFNTFISTTETDVSYLAPSESAVTVTAGVDDPADAAAEKVGQYVRGTDQFSDLKFQMDFDIQFDNFTSFSIEVYIPSSNTFEEGGLTKNIQLWIADFSQTQEFWGSWVQYDVDPESIPVDTWKTYTFQLESPSAGTGTPKTRTDLDLVGLVIGGSNHVIDGTFYIRNFKFE